MNLGVDADELAACVACGLCLPHCPTFRVSGEEMRSPRGRIAAMRAVASGHVDAGPDFVRVVDECVLCRGCEPACPSGVPFGRLMEGTRETLALQSRSPARRAALWILGHHRLLLATSTALAVAHRAGLVPRRLGLPRLPLRRPRLRASGGDVVLFTGCVMDAWMREVHVAAQRVIEATGAGVALPPPGAACCGALHVHSGLVTDARRLAERVIGALPGEAPIIVDSAGCGAALKDYGHLLGTEAAIAFAARVVDINEWLVMHADRLPAGSLPSRVVVQDPCHLRHVQKAHLSVRTLLRRYAEVVELDDDGLCCGAGGAYSLSQPALAREIRSQKVESIGRTGATVVASANPGCIMHLGAAGVDVRHPVQLVWEAIGGG